MDPREREGEHEEALQAMLDGFQGRVWTALPGIIQSFDAEKMTCEVQPSLQGQLQDRKGNWNNTNLPLCVDCPVVFPRAGGFTLTFPIQQGDECLLVFASRNIDAWWQNGGVQPQDRFRMHDLSDGFVILAPSSQPKKLANISTNTVQLRNDAGDTYVEIDGAQNINLVAPGVVTITSPTVHMTGDLNVDGTITGSTDVLAGPDNISGKEHIHSGVTIGAADTGTPVP